ncbi:NAD-dependent epimerase/dehydratase family protein [Leptolinea tardivitalis]|uniref:NAD-dependent epimerase/dehydratase domain-containing protein n=1 Tax=Leptolinea tardivitalis TaxID=229920 RepID=A0A0P6XGJ4_9CHLR|nr:NAD(P)-dependent oxidoreductase [Leptolinea tardivitalis]KPL70209.1 hypothetical protein ADM99_13550 [Leptolinea tardivitalis]GAP21744.1 nucleoside-diphosphate-sugar epimerase [Leptolinea tardivitalis]
MKTAAIIGANSMLGSRLEAILKSDGIRVIRVGLFDGADIKLDLTRGFLSPLPSDLTADTVFHVASAFADDSPQGLRTNFSINSAGSLWALDLARMTQAKSLIYAGSLSSFEGLEPGKMTSYGLTKALAENLLDWGMKNLQASFCSLRYSQLYDTEGLCCQHQKWFGRIIGYASRGLDIHMPASEGKRNFIHVDDAARLLIQASEHVISGILPVVHPITNTYDEIAHMAYAIFNKGGQIIIDTKKPPFRPINFPETGETYKLLHYVPVISMESGITRIRDEGTALKFGPLDVS